MEMDSKFNTLWLTWEATGYEIAWEEGHI
jgi:hypothetical protein